MPNSIKTFKTIEEAKADNKVWSDFSESEFCAKSYKDPMSLEAMRDPVSTEDGHTYERAEIERWFKQGKNTSPNTNKPLASKKLTPNHAFKQSIDEAFEKYVKANNLIDNISTLQLDLKQELPEQIQVKKQPQVPMPAPTSTPSSFASYPMNTARAEAKRSETNAMLPISKSNEDSGVHLSRSSLNIFTNSLANEDCNHKFKVQVVGGCYVGKSNLILRFTSDSFSENHIENLRSEFTTMTNIDDERVELKIRDSKYSVGMSNFHGYDGIVLAVDLTDRSTLELAANLQAGIREHGIPNIPILLVATKKDLVDQHRIKNAELTEFARKHNLLGPVYTSSKTGESINEAFMTMAFKLMDIKRDNTRKYYITLVEAYIVKHMKEFKAPFKKDHRSTLGKIANRMFLLESINVAKALLKVLRKESDISSMVQHEKAIRDEELKKIYDGCKRLLIKQEQASSMIGSNNNNIRR